MDKTGEKRAPNHGQKAAYVVIVILCLTNLAIFFLWQFYDGKDNYSRKYSYIDISRDFISQENFIVNIQPLREKLNAMTDEFGRNKVSIYIEFLNSGANISINPDVYIWQASLAKIPLAMAVMKKIEEGDWKLENELVLMPNDRNDESGDIDSPLSEYPVGSRFTIAKLLEELLVNSDNTAYYILLRNIHADELNRIVDDLGLEQLYTEDGRISAKEYSRIFRALYTSSFLTREHSQMMLKWLDESPFNDFLAFNLDKNVPFPHKYGEKINLNVYSDSGIVYVADRPFLITVMVQGDTKAAFASERQKAADFMRAVSLEAYNYFFQFNR